MAPSRNQTNGRSPLVNQQRQITSFFSKSSTSISPSPSPILSKQKQKQKPNPSPLSHTKPSPTLSPSPSTPSPTNPKRNKPLLVIGPSSPSPSTSPLLDKPSYGQEVVGRRIKVYWPLDKSWYEGCVRSFDKLTGKHVVLYDDDEEESLDLAKENIEWFEETVKKLKRLRRGFSAPKQMVIDEEDAGADNVGVRAEETRGDDDDSSDEDWGKNEVVEDADEEMELEDEEDIVGRSKGKGNGSFEPTKRKLGGGKKIEPVKKRKTGVDFGKVSIKSSSPEPTATSIPESK